MEKIQLKRSKSECVESSYRDELVMQEQIRKNTQVNFEIMKKKMNDCVENLKRIKNPAAYRAEEAKGAREKSFLASEKLANTKKQTYSDFPVKKRLKKKNV